MTVTEPVPVTVPVTIMSVTVLVTGEGGISAVAVAAARLHTVHDAARRALPHATHQVHLPQVRHQ